MNFQPARDDLSAWVAPSKAMPTTISFEIATELGSVSSQRHTHAGDHRIRCFCPSHPLRHDKHSIPFPTICPAKERSFLCRLELRLVRDLPRHLSEQDKTFASLNPREQARHRLQFIAERHFLRIPQTPGPTIYYSLTTTQMQVIHSTKSTPERWQFAVIGAIWITFLAVGLRCIYNRAYMGQDFAFHSPTTAKFISDPDRWFYMDYTSRPLLYWIGSATARFTNHQYNFELAAIINLILSSFSIWLLYASLKYCINSVSLRLVATAFITLLPVNIITTIVYAADTTAILPFCLICFGLIKANDATSRIWSTWGSILAGLGLAVGQFSKFTFTTLPVAVVIALLCAFRFRIISPKILLRCAALCTIIPLTIGFWLHKRGQKELQGETPRHGYVWSGTGEMSFSRLVWPAKGDSKIFDAPLYWDVRKENGADVQIMTQNNAFSYPALLHLGVFSDVLGVTLKNIVGQPERPSLQQRYAQLLLRLGLLVSFPIVIVSVGFALRAIAGLFSRRPPSNFGTWIWGALGLAWFLPIVLMLPFIKSVYTWGYWLPRLVLPGIWGVSVILFAALSYWLQQNPRWEKRGTVTASLLICLISYMSVRSLWI